MLNSLPGNSFLHKPDHFGREFLTNYSYCKSVKGGNMGKQNLAVNQLLERKEIFADLINGALYEGQQILNPDDMELVSGQAGLMYENDFGKKQVLERRGDVRMRAAFGVFSVIFANETQQGVHYAMPVRGLLYDALEYTKQVQILEKNHKDNGDKLRTDEFLSGITKEDKLIPVISTVLYFGNHWDGSTSLYEMMGLEENSEYIENLKQYLPDYRINLICGNNIENPELFRTSLQQIFSMLKYNKDKGKLYRYVKQHKEELNRMDSVEQRAMLTLMGEQKRLMKLLEQQKEEVTLHMSQAIDELIQDGVEYGEQRMADLIIALANHNQQHLIKKAAADHVLREQLYQQYHICPEKPSGY